MTDFTVPVGHRLRRMRVSAALTQEQVAVRMNTKQAAVARIEADKRGSTSLARIADYAIACGMIPLSFIHNGVTLLDFVPLLDARDFILAHPQDELTLANYIYWKAMEVEPTQQYTLSCAITMAP